MNKSTCSTCEYSWETGRDGSHRCADKLKADLSVALAKVEQLKHAAGGELARRLVTQFVESGAVNYQESHFEIEFKDDRQSLAAVVTLQNPGKPSPHMLRVEAETQRDQLAELLRKAVDENDAYERGERVLGGWVNEARVLLEGL
jgi:hypothetical protein